MTKLKSCIRFLAAAFLAAGCVQPLPLPHGGDDDDDEWCGGYGGGGQAGWSGAGGKAGWGGSGGKAGSGGGSEPPREALSEAEVLGLLRGDLASLPRAARRGARYVSLHGLYNSRRFSTAELFSAANAVSKLANHLSPLQAVPRRPGLVLTEQGVPVALRIDLSDFDLDASDWALAERAGDVVGREESPCDVPVLSAEQFLGVGSSDSVFTAVGREALSVYSNVALRRSLAGAGVLAPNQLVFEPLSEQQFVANGFTNFSSVSFLDVAHALGVDLAADLAGGNEDGRVARACALNSDASAAARCVERHARPSGPGPGPGLWWTMDLLAPGGGGGDPFLTPVGPANGGLVPASGDEQFSFDAGEAFWSWPNGTLGFATFDANFYLLSTSPTYGPLDSESPPAANGAACFGCHASGPLEVRDGLLPLALAGGAPDWSASELGFVFAHVAPQVELDAVVDVDGQQYVEAVRETVFFPAEDGTVPDGVTAFGSVYAFDLDFEQLVASLAMSEEEFFAHVDSNPELWSYFLFSHSGETTITRENFILLSRELRQMLGSPAEGLLSSCVVGDLGDVSVNVATPARD